MIPMPEAQKLIQVISDIYDAALNPAQWSSVVAKIAEFSGGQAGGLALQDAARKNVNVYYDAGFDPQCIQVYLETYSKLDPLASAPPIGAGRVVSVAELMPYDDYLGGR